MPDPNEEAGGEEGRVRRVFGVNLTCYETDEILVLFFSGLFEAFRGHSPPPLRFSGQPWRIFVVNLTCYETHEI